MSPATQKAPTTEHNLAGATAQTLGDGRPTAASDDVERLSPR